MVAPPVQVYTTLNIAPLTRDSAVALEAYSLFVVTNSAALAARPLAYHSVCLNHYFTHLDFDGVVRCFYNNISFPFVIVRVALLLNTHGTSSGGLAMVSMRRCILARFLHLNVHSIFIVSPCCRVFITACSSCCSMS